MEDLSGKQLGQYQLVLRLGRGGMASVYKAYQPGTDRYVAIKILPRDELADPNFLNRFRQEARIIANLEHTHILPVYDYGEANGYTYLVMRLVEGGTLADLLHGQPLPLERIGKIISQIAEALDYAHSRGVIHRDIKPQNILIDATGRCLLSDFGIAKSTVSSAHFTVTGKFVGTPQYASPEQALGQDLDGRSDIYSLGVILYEMATGKAPYEADTPMAMVIKHINEPLPPPRSINPSLSPAVESVITRALAKDRRDRFQTSGELAAALTAAIIPGAQFDDQQTLLDQVSTVVERTPTPMPVAQARSMPRPTFEEPISRRGLPVWIWAVGGTGLLLLCTAIILVAVLEPLRFLNSPSTALENATTTPTVANTPAPTGLLTQITSTLPASSQPTNTPQPTITPTTIKTDLLPTPTTQDPTPTLLLDKNSNCRSGPGKDYEELWSFFAGEELEIIGKDNTGWYLIRFHDPRTRKVKCWIGGGIVRGDEANIPFSSYTGQGYED